MAKKEDKAKAKAEAEEKPQAEESPFVPRPAPVDWMDEELKKEGRENEIK